MSVPDTENTLTEALRSWPCWRCNGRRVETCGCDKQVCYEWCRAGQPCETCNGDGLHPTASAALAAVRAVPPATCQHGPFQTCSGCAPESWMKPAVPDTDRHAALTEHEREWLRAMPGWGFNADHGTINGAVIEAKFDALAGLVLGEGTSE